MSRSFLRSFILLFITSVFTAGCSVAVPNVTSLLSSLNSFKLTSNDYRISALSELSNITLSANCDMTNTGFEYELTDVAAGTWIPVPMSSTAPFTTINNQCSTSGMIYFTLDLSSTSPFSTMIQGETKTITFRDVNLLPELSHSEEFRITYSAYKISDDRFINGQGYNTTKTGTTHSLKGRIINIQTLDSVSSGSYTLQGKAVFQ